jgi:hypothetical protein
MLGLATTLPDGSRMRVRLPHALDRAGLRALHARLGLHAEEFDIAHTLRFDPRQEAVACATAWVGGSEMLVGYGAMRLGAEEPHLLVSDEALAPGAGEALATALRERASGRDAA